MILALDLSTACTGYALYNTDGSLIDFSRILPNDKDHNFLKIKYIVNKILPEMLSADDLVVEGIFLNTFTGGLHNVTGFELLARLSGAIINKWLERKTKMPVIYKATEARKLVGVKGSAQKAEVQLWALRNFKINQNVTTDELDDWEALIDAEYASLNAGEMKRPTFKTHMSNISKTIEEETGIGEDVADAILLGKAYVQDSRNKKNNSNPEQSVS